MATTGHWEAYAERLIREMCNKALVEEPDPAKMSFLRIAADHRDHCAPGCGISLSHLLEVATEAGMKFTDEERALFF